MVNSIRSAGSGPTSAALQINNAEQLDTMKKGPTSEDTVMDLDRTEVSDISESSLHCTICNTMPQLSSGVCPVLCCPCPVLHGVCLLVRPYNGRARTH